MTKSVKIGLRILTGSIVILTIVLLLLVRFTDGTIKGGDKIILGYDEGEGKFQFLEKRLHELKGVDGPYIIGDELITITGQNEIKKSILRSDAVEVTVRNKDKDRFTVPLKQHFVPPPDEYAMPDQLIAISDIEGNFDGFSGFLQKNKVIDDQFNWIYGEGHLVLIGDFVDRGNNVLPILWLIYKLEIEAAEAGGKVHYILGNHEIMNIQGDFSYAQNKYRKIAAMIGGQKASIDNNKILFSANSHLGKWMRSKNIIEKIGDYIFVHGGLSPELLFFNLEINEMNTIVRENIDLNLNENPNNDAMTMFLMGAQSPFWYRGLVMDTKHYEKIKEEQLNDILNKYHSKKVVIGHTIVEDVSKDFGGRVIRIDVTHALEKFSGNTKGLYITNEQEFQVNGLGQTTEF